MSSFLDYSTAGNTPRVPFPIKSARNPTSSDVLSPDGNYYPVGIIWVNTVSFAAFYYAGFGNWQAISFSGGSPSFATLTVTGLASVGSLASTGAITGSSVTTTGNITTTAGNLEATGAGTGLLLDPTLVVAGASPQTANGRVVVVTFSGVSIAAAATQTFVITNSAITGAATDIQYTMVGATSGAALNIQSVTNSAGSSSIVVENGTGASTSTANITFTGIVLN